jgi:hypothetical protein
MIDVAAAVGIRRNDPPTKGIATDRHADPRITLRLPIRGKVTAPVTPHAAAASAEARHQAV